MNEFDVAARRAVRDDAAGHVGWLLPHLPATLRYQRMLESQSAPRPGEPDRRCDTIAELVHEGGLGEPWATVIELFTDADSDASDRLLEYIGRFRRELRHGPYGHDRYRFAGALLFLTDGPESAGIGDALPGGDCVLSFAPRLMRLAKEDAIATMARIEQNQLAASILAWIPLMTGGQTAEAVADWRRIAEAREPDEQRRRGLAGLAVVFSELTDCLETWQKGLEGFAMRESTVLRREREEGRIENGRENLIRVLRLRFGQENVATLEGRVQLETRPEELARWLDLAVTAKDLPAFLADVGG